MSGLVKSWNAGTKVLVVTVDLIGPSPAAASDWNISVTGEKGDQGPPGGFGSLVAAKGTIPTGDGTTFRAMLIGADGTVPIADSTQPFGFAWRAEEAINAGPYWGSTDVPSAATCDIGAATTPRVRVTGSTTITSFGTAPNRVRFVVFTDALTLVYNGTSLILPGPANITTRAGDKGTFISDEFGNWACYDWTPIASIPRQTLTDNLTFYVRTDGSDNNNGLSNTSGGAFKTLQKAANVAMALDLSIFNITINVGDGTYTSGVRCGPLTGSGVVTFVGNIATPANCFISTTAAADYPFFITAGTWAARGFKTQTSGAATDHIRVNGYANFNYGEWEFGSAVGNSQHVIANQYANVTFDKDYTISGGANAHWNSNNSGTITRAPNLTITIVGTPAFTTAFCTANRGASATVAQLTFSGSATGPRYSVTGVSQISTFGAGANYLPGSSAGTADATTFGSYS